MPLSEQQIHRFLMQSPQRISAAANLVVKGADVPEDIFQKTVLKAVSKDVSFEAEAVFFPGFSSALPTTLSPYEKTNSFTNLMKMKETEKLLWRGV